MSRSSREPELRAGDVFGGYEIVRPLGAGGYGAVYEALRLPLRKRTALKVLHREHAREDHLLDRFAREAQIAGRLDHPHIVTVFDVGVHDGQPYIAMELLDGESLAALIERGGPMSAAAAVDLLLPVLSAVAAVHEKGVIHRDLKPDNIFLARPGIGAVVPKLLDFGIAKARDTGHSLTATSSMLGTPSYMSPEQVRESKHVDARSDQWSLAVILFECLTGDCPFRGDSLLEVLVAISAGPIPMPRALRPDLPEDLEASLLRAMERTPEARWPSVHAFGASLLPFASEAGRAQWSTYFTTGADIGRRSTLPQQPAPAMAREETLSPTTRSSDHPPRRSPRRRAGVIAMVAAAAGIAAVAGLTLHTPAPPATHPAPVTVVRPQRAAPVVAAATTPAAPVVPEAAPVRAAGVAPTTPTVAVAAPAAPVEAETPTVAEESPSGERSRRRRHHRAHRHGETESRTDGETLPNL